MRIGVLALQGAFAEHEQMLEKLGAEVFEIRQRKDLDKEMDGFILPGGESTVIGRLLKDLALFDPIKKMVESGLPVFGTCAGLLLLAREIENDRRSHLGTMNLTARRNAYGRQLGSYHIEEEFKGIGKVPMTFIRAPYIAHAGEDAEVLAEVEGQIVAARQDNQLVTAFHPELSEDSRIHKYFLDIVKEHMI